MKTPKRMSGRCWTFVTGAGITLFIARFMLYHEGFISTGVSNAILIAGIATLATAGVLAAIKRVDWSVI